MARAGARGGESVSDVGAAREPLVEPEECEAKFSLVRMLSLLAAVGLPIVYLMAAVTRRLNFDESLALRAGWLQWAGIAGEPDFYMPTTVSLGILAHSIGDPGLVFAIARSFVAVAVLGAGAFALYRARLSFGAAVAAAAICFAQGSFGVYSYEFRYDWAIMTAWLIAFALLQRRTTLDYLICGGLVVWLAAHHVKGASFALALYVMCLIAIFAARDRRARAAALHLGIGGAAAGWLLATHALGFQSLLFGTYRTFVSLAAGGTKVWPWESLGQAVLQDAVWWSLAFAASVWVGVHGWRLATSGRPILPALLESRRVWALGFGLVPVFFLFVHPHPWPYMLALPAPFFAILLADGADTGWHRLGPRSRLVAFSLLLASVLAAGSLAGNWPGTGYVGALVSPGTHQVETLRLLKRLSAPSERVIDPSGVAYFLPPCVDQWYLDTLFERRAREGAWMSGLAVRKAADCPWIVNTYRMGMLPSSILDRLNREYQSASGGLALPSGDARLAVAEHWADLPHTELRSFWW